MKISKYLFLLLFVPVFFYAQSGPKFHVDDETFKTGTHLRGKEVTYDIPFKNAGDQNLKIESVVTSCGCSSALLSSDLLAPGETGTIKFVFNGNGIGDVQKSVMVTTNETENNQHNLIMVMNMVEPLSVTPASIMATGKVGDEILESASLLNSFTNEVQISEITSNSPAVVITSDKTTIGPNETVKFVISIKIYEESPVNAAVLIKTSAGEYQIPILVDVTSASDVKSEK